MTRLLFYTLTLRRRPHLKFASRVELLQFPLGGVHVGEAGSFAQHPGVLQGLPDTEALVRVEDNQLTDLQRHTGAGLRS